MRFEKDALWVFDELDEEQRAVFSRADTLLDIDRVYHNNPDIQEIVDKRLLYMAINYSVSTPDDIGLMNHSLLADIAILCDDFAGVSKDRN